MGSTRYKKHEGGVFTLHYHFVWCPKYRRKVLLGTIAERLEELLREKASELGVEIEGLEVLPDHVHLFVAAAPTDAPQYLANQFKGYTSRVLRSEFPGLKSRLPSLWSRSYYVGSAGHVEASTIRQYIEQQKRS
jgi:REP-associated tyrosine transposase